MKSSSASSSLSEGLPQHVQAEIQRDLKALRLKQRGQRSQLTLMQSPLKTMKYFMMESMHHVHNAVLLLYRHWLLSALLLSVLIALVVLRSVQGPHEQFVHMLFERGGVALEWMVLGVLSSVGLGTGLHTFVLYLGPYIAKVTLAATECNSIDFPTIGEGAFLCPPGDRPSLAAAITFWSILSKVQFEALCWGLGTAIGELPPYFVARAARLSGKKLESVEGDDEEEEDDDDDETPESESGKGKEPSLMDKVMTKARSIMDLLMGRYPFITILLMASVPNPLFDLAGLTCGYALIPFWVFFGATIIGKSFIKAHLQAMTVVMIFSKEHLGTIIYLIEKLLPFLRGKASAYFDKERQRFHPDSVGNVSASVESKSMLARTWDVVLITMLAMFAISIINSMAQSRMMEQQKQELDTFKSRRIDQLLQKADKKSKSEM